MLGSAAEVSPVENKQPSSQSLDSGYESSSVVDISSCCVDKSDKMVCEARLYNSYPITRLHGRFEARLRFEKNLYSKSSTNFYSKSRYVERPAITDDLENLILNIEKFNQKEWNYRDSRGNTTLHSAIETENRIQLVQMILNLSVRPLINIQNNDGHTSLHLAVIKRQPYVISLLIQHGALITRSTVGNTPLHLATTAAYEDCLKILLEMRNSGYWHLYLKSMKASLNYKNYQGQTCTHIAAVSGNLEMMKLLVKAGADINARDGLGGRTPLMFAILKRRRNLIEYFLASNIDFEVKNFRGQTAYHVALGEEDDETAEDLLDLGVSSAPPTLPSGNCVCSTSESDCESEEMSEEEVQEEEQEQKEEEEVNTIDDDDDDDDDDDTKLSV